MEENKKGSYTVEFSLLLPIIMMIAIFFFELGYYQQKKLEATHTVTEVCGEDFMAKIAEYSDCDYCYGSVTLNDGYYDCIFVDQHAQITGLLPDAMVPIEIRVEALRRQTEDIEEMIKEYLEEGETGE